MSNLNEPSNSIVWPPEDTTSHIFDDEFTLDLAYNKNRREREDKKSDKETTQKSR